MNQPTEWTHEKIQEFADTALQTAKKNLLADGELMPVMFLLTKEAGAIVIGLSFRNTEEKRKIYSNLEKLIRLYKPAAVIMVNESWYKKTDPDDKEAVARMERNGVRAEPDRQEAIIVVVSPLEGADRMTVQMFHHEGEAIVFDGEPGPMDSGGSFTSRLLPPTWKHAPAS